MRPYNPDKPAYSPPESYELNDLSECKATNNSNSSELPSVSPVTSSADDQIPKFMLLPDEVLTRIMKVIPDPFSLMSFICAYPTLLLRLVVFITDDREMKQQFWEIPNIRKLTFKRYKVRSGFSDTPRAYSALLRLLEITKSHHSDAESLYVSNCVSTDSLVWVRDSATFRGGVPLMKSYMEKRNARYYCASESKEYKGHSLSRKLGQWRALERAAEASRQSALVMAPYVGDIYHGLELEKSFKARRVRIHTRLYELTLHLTTKWGHTRPISGLNAPHLTNFTITYTGKFPLIKKMSVGYGLDPQFNPKTFKLKRLDHSVERAKMITLKNTEDTMEDLELVDLAFVKNFRTVHLEGVPDAVVRACRFKGTKSLSIVKTSTSAITDNTAHTNWFDSGTIDKFYFTTYAKNTVLPRMTDVATSMVVLATHTSNVDLQPCLTTLSVETRSLVIVHDNSLYMDGNLVLSRDMMRLFAANRTLVNLYLKGPVSLDTDYIGSADLVLDNIGRFGRLTHLEIDMSYNFLSRNENGVLLSMSWIKHLFPSLWRLHLTHSDPSRSHIKEFELPVMNSLRFLKVPQSITRVAFVGDNDLPVGEGEWIWREHMWTARAWYEPVNKTLKAREWVAPHMVFKKRSERYVTKVKESGISTYFTLVLIMSIFSVINGVVLCKAQ